MLYQYLWLLNEMAISLLSSQAGFQKAMELVGTEFLDRLDYYHRAWLPARTLVEEAIQERFKVPLLLCPLVTS